MKKDINFLMCLVFLAAITLMPVLAYAQSSDAVFQQAVADYQKSPSSDGADKVIKLAVAMEKLPPVPEEARKHFFKGAALFKDAKSPADFTQVLDEFKQVVRLAPWWPEARYNFALACESAGEYASAIANLKLYQLFKLPDAEARSIQDKIYVLEARQEKAAKESSPEALAQKQQDKAEAFFKSLNGARFVYYIPDPECYNLERLVQVQGNDFVITETATQVFDRNCTPSNMFLGVPLETVRVSFQECNKTIQGDDLVLVPPSKVFFYKSFTISGDGNRVTLAFPGGKNITNVLTRK
jgi:tetratricopeptide (TPR) repeat protein